MSRLLAAVGEVEAELFHRLRAAGHRCPDGWGIAWWGPSQGYLRAPVGAHLTGSGFDDAVRLMSVLRFTSVLGHVRRAGHEPVSVDATQPYLQRGWAFACAGTFPAAEEYRPGAEALASRIAGAVRAGLPVPDALARALVTGGGEGHLVLSDGRRLYAAEVNPRQDAELALYWSDEGGRLAVASAGVAPPTWHRLGDHRLFFADLERETAEVTELPQ